MKDLNVEHLFLPAITKKPYASLNLPGSKSIANRILLLAALAEGESIIHNIPDVAHDIIIMQNALKILGINIYRIDNLNTDTTENATYRIQGCAGNFPQRTAYILCGNSVAFFI